QSTDGVGGHGSSSSGATPPTSTAAVPSVSASCTVRVGSARTISSSRERPSTAFVYHGLAPSQHQHGCRLLLAACAGGAVGGARGYRAGVMAPRSTTSGHISGAPGARGAGGIPAPGVRVRGGARHRRMHPRRDKREPVTDGFLTQAQYARRRGVSRVSVHRRTVTVGGPIPVHGRRKLINVAEADALWEATKSNAGASHVNGNGAAAPSPGASLAQARAAALGVEVELKRLALAKLRGELMSREAAIHKAFECGRRWRDAWVLWAARIGPLIAAAFDVDAGAMTVMLEGHVRDHLTELANERVEF